jgi:hypothetical protein
MTDPTKAEPLLTAQAIGSLQSAKQQLVDAAAGKIPERLVLATVEAVVRLARKEAAGEVLSERVLELVRRSLTALGRQKWKPDTALLLKRREEGGHGLSR